jgi:phosphotransferase system IIA component
MKIFGKTLLAFNIGSKLTPVPATAYVPRWDIVFKKRKRFALPLPGTVMFTLKHLLLVGVILILGSLKTYAQAPTISYSPSTYVFTVGTAIAPINPTTGGGPADSYTSDPLPAGLSIDPTTGIISGTPTAVTATNTYTVTAVSAANGNGTTTITLTVNPAAPAFTYPTPDVFVYGTAISSQSPTNTGGPPDSYSVSPALPSGLSLDPTTGVISGTPTAVAGAADYVVTATNVTASSTFTINITVNQAVLTVSGLTANNKIYDQNTTVTGFTGGTLNGVVPGDAVTLVPSGTFATQNVGTGIAVTSTSTLSGAQAGNYILTQPTGLSADITAKALTITGAAGVNKIYDQTTAATITGTLSGIISGDGVTLNGTGTFATQNVGTGIAITSTSTLGGPQAGNYTLTQPTGLTANITAKTLTITGAAANNKVYDGTTAATISGTLSGVISGDAVTLSGTGTFASANVGTNIAVTSTSTLSGAQAGDYTLTQPTGLTANITSGTLTITGMTANNKVYDGTTTASFTGGTLNGVASGDVVTFTPSGTFATANVGTGIVVTSTTTLGGANAGNYTLTQPTGLTANITAKTLTVTGATASNKVYDATTTATITGGTLVGVLAADVGNVTLVPSGTFATKNVGTGIAVTSTSTLSGTAAGNYTLTQPTGLTANITAVTLTITGLTTNPASGVTYTGTTVCPLKGTGSLVGVLAADAGNVTLVGSPTGTFPSANVGTWTITITGYSLGGTASGNYTLNSSITGKIVAASITITPTPLSKVYGTTEPSSVTGQTTFTVSGLQNGETIGTVTINYGVQAQNIREQVGTYSSNASYSTTASNAAGGTFTASNYNITYATGTFTVTPAPFYWVGATSTNWRTTSNWYSAGLQQDYDYPGKTNSADVVYIAVAGGPSGTPSTVSNSTVVLDSTLTVASITIGNAGTSTININPNTSIKLTTSGGFTINSGTLTVNMVTNNPTLTIGGNYTASGSGNIFNISSSNATTITGTTTNAGTFNQQGTGTVTMTGATTNTGTINQTSTGAMVFTGDFTNSGSTSAFKQTGSGTVTFSGALTNAGAFTQASGAITVVGTLTNSSTGVLTLGSASFTMSSGDYINTGTFTAGSGTVFFTATTGIQKLYGGSGTGTVFKNVTFNGNATKQMQTGTFGLSTSGVLSFTGSSTTLNVNSGATFTIYSAASGSGTIAAIPTGCSITGNVTVQRYMSAVRGYRLMSSPVYAGNDGTNNYYGLSYLETNCYLTGDGGGWDKSGNPTLYLYRENVVPTYTTFYTSNFRGVSNITNSAAINMDDGAYNPTDIPVGNGYLFFYRGSRNQMTLAAATTPGAAATNDTLNAVGTLIQGTIVVHDWYTPSSANIGYTTISGTATVEGSNLIGNPYASSIDFDNFSSSSASASLYGPNVSPNCYELVLTGQGAGNYNVYTAGSNIGGNKQGTQGRPNSNIIVSGEGFFVFATKAGASLTFKESVKTNTQVTGTSLYMSSKHLALNNSEQYLRLQLSADTINTDGTIIRFNDNAKQTFDLMEDAIYRVGTGKVSLSSLSSDNVPLAINQLPLLHGDTIGLKVKTSATGNYALTMADLRIPQLFDVWLMDAFAKDSVNMRNTTSYNFAVTADTNSYGSHRFSVVIRENPALAYKLLSFNGQKTGKRAVQLTWQTQNEQNYTNFTVERSADDGKTYDVIGSLASTGAGAYSLVDPEPQKGNNWYRLKSEDYNNTITYSNVINEQFQDNGNDKSSHLSLYPNPAVNTIHLTIVPRSQDKTTYGIRISNGVGLVVKYATISDVNWQNNVSELLSGTYLIEVIDNKDNSIVGQTKFVKM